MMDSNAESFQLNGLKLFLKKPQHLMRQSLPNRWEVTRRHPHYLEYWEAASKIIRSESGEVSQTRSLDLARLILLGIGISNQYPPPDTPFEKLDDHILASIWIDGVIAPQTMRSLLLNLINSLSPQGCLVAGTLMYQRGTLEENNEDTLFNYLQSVSECEWEELDSFPKGPLIALNPFATKNALEKAFGKYVVELKSNGDFEEHRQRSDKIKEYLAVWDLREGWTGSGYDIHKEKSWQQISDELNIQVQTARKRYNSAFYEIVGKDYSFADWFVLFGSVKASKLLKKNQIPQRYILRSERTQSVEIVPETRLNKESDSDSFLDNVDSENSDVVFHDAEHQLFHEILDLIKSGKTDDEIITLTDLHSDQAIELISYLRQHPSYELELPS